MTLRLFLPGAFARLAPSLAEQLVPIVETRVTFHEFIASGLLADRIRAGEPADLYVSANWRYATDLYNEGLIHAPRQFAGNRLCIVTPPDRPVTRLADLMVPGIRVLLPQAQTDPCGQYVQRMFGRAGLERVLAAKEARGDIGRAPGSARLISQLLAEGYDAGMLYWSEAIGIPAVRITDIPLSLDMHDAIAFVVAPTGSPDTENAAAETAAAWFAGAGQRFWMAHGFLPRLWTT